MLNCNSIANLLREICEKIAVCVMCLTPEMFGRIGKSNGIIAPVSVGAHPRNPTAWTPQRLGVPLPALASRLADLVGQHEPWRMQRVLLSLPFCLPSLH